jgi:hypothetical protein
VEGIEYKSRMAIVRERTAAVQEEAEAMLLGGLNESFSERVKFAGRGLRELGGCALEIVRLVPHIPEVGFSEARRKAEFHK